MGCLISVILPTKNAATYLEDCLESLRRQTFCDFEVCVIDACSKDGTREVALSFSDSEKMALRWWSEPDSGVYAAMNKGIGFAQGEWLYFLGADDILHDENVFFDMARYLSEESADIVYGDVVRKSDGHRYCGSSSWHRLILDRNICHQAIFYRRAVFEYLGGYDEKYRSWADWAFNIRCFRQPDIRTRWVNRVIAIYNNATGVSCQIDPELAGQLPPKWIRNVLGRLYRLAARVASS